MISRSLRWQQARLIQRQLTKTKQKTKSGFSKIHPNSTTKSYLKSVCTYYSHISSRLLIQSFHLSSSFKTHIVSRTLLMPSIEDGSSTGGGRSGDLTVFCGAKRNPDIFPRCRQDEQTTSGQPDRRASAKQQKQGISFCLLLLLIMEVRRSLLLISTID